MALQGLGIEGSIIFQDYFSMIISGGSRARGSIQQQVLVLVAQHLPLDSKCMGVHGWVSLKSIAVHDIVVKHCSVWHCCDCIAVHDIVVIALQCMTV